MKLSYFRACMVKCHKYNVIQCAVILLHPVGYHLIEYEEMLFRFEMREIRSIKYVIKALTGAIKTKAKENIFESRTNKNII